jgi:hypothetical protein
MVGRLPYRAEAGPIYMLAWLAPPQTMMLALYGSGLAPLIMFFVLSSTFAVAVLDATSPEPRQLAAV